MMGVRRTWLAPGADGVWRRRDRATHDRAVQLAAAAETLLVSESIETTVSAMQSTGMGCAVDLRDGRASAAGDRAHRHDVCGVRVVILRNRDAGEDASLTGISSLRMISRDQPRPMQRKRPCVGPMPADAPISAPQRRRCNPLRMAMLDDDVSDLYPEPER